MELMVVVILISILAVLAVPQMREARDDRLAFDYARRIEQLIHRARPRAASRGAAHLVLATPGGGRGQIFLFEALDNTPPPAGPNPVSSCKTADQWVDALNFQPGITVSNKVRLVEAVELNVAAGINVDADIKALFSIAGGAPGSTTAIAMCVTPSGTTYVGAGSTAVDAITSNTGMVKAVIPFASFFEVAVSRNRGAATVGLTRRVVVAGTAAPRIRSQ